MNHIQAIEAGAASGAPYHEIVRKVYLTYPTKAFVGFEDQQYEVLNEIAQYFNVPITAVQVTGSAKLGRSLHKQTDFVPGESDLDVAIIDAISFVWNLELGLRVSKGYSNRASFPLRHGQSTQEMYIQYISKGIFRPDLMPNCPERAQLHNFFGLLSNKHTNIFGSISAAIYVSQACFESKQRSAVKIHIENRPL
jgi:hypothetical protein